MDTGEVNEQKKLHSSFPTNQPTNQPKFLLLFFSRVCHRRVKCGSFSVENTRHMEERYSLGMVLEKKNLLLFFRGLFFFLFF